MELKGLLNIIDTLQQISEEITDKIHWPNYGGCAVIAAEVATKLAKFIPVNVVIEPYWGVPIDLDIIVNESDLNEMETARDWNEVGIQFKHVLLKFDLDGDTYLFDSNGLVPIEESTKTLCDGTFPLEETVKISQSEKGWNSDFNRAQIPDIQRIVENAFQQLSPSES